MLLSMYVYDFIKKRRSFITVSLIEIILFILIVWSVICNNRLLNIGSDLDLFQSLSLLFIVSLLRQIVWREKSRSEESGKNNRTAITFIRALWILGVCQAILGIGQYFSFPDFLPIGLMKTPMIGTIGHANGFGSFLAASLMALFVDYQDITQIRQKYPRWIAGGIIAVALILNGSRGAILALVCALIVFSYINFRVERNLPEGIKAPLKVNRILPVIIVLFAILVGLFYFLYNLNIESSKGRLFVWDVAAPMIKDHPVSGVGLGRFSVEYLNFQSRFFADGRNNALSYKAANMKQAHNEYFQAFCEMGIIGGILFLGLWIFVLWLLFFRKKEQTIEYGIGAILLTILLHSLVDTPLHILPIAIVAYSLIGLTSLPSSYTHTVTLRSKTVQFAVITIFATYAIFALTISLNQYRGFSHWQKGYEYAKERRWSPAILEYQAALQSFPQKGELLFHTGAALVLDGSYSAGIFYLQESLPWYNDRNIYLSLSLANLQLGNLQEAEVQAQKALSMFPDQLAPHLLLGQIFFKQSRIDESQKSLLKCIYRQTSIQSDDVQQISLDAREFWNTYYHESIPSLEDFKKE